MNLPPGLAALAALAAVFALVDPEFASPANLAIVLDGCAVGVVIATGMTFVIRQGSLDLSVEGVMAASSLVFALSVANDRSPAGLGWFALLLGAAFGGAFGLASGILVTRLHVPSFMATLGLGSMAFGAAMLLSGDRPPLVRDEALRSWALSRSFGVPNLALLALACLFAGWLLERFTRMGRYNLAIGAAEDLARACGVDVAFHKVAVFAFAGGMSGLAAVMESARLGLGHAAVGTGQMLGTLAAVVVGGTSLSGGTGSVLGSAAGVLALGVVANGLVFVGAAPWVDKCLQGVVIVLAVLAVWPVRGRLVVVK